LVFDCFGINIEQTSYAIYTQGRIAPQTLEGCFPNIPVTDQPVIFVLVFVGVLSGLPGIFKAAFATEKTYQPLGRSPSTLDDTVSDDRFPIVPTNRVKTGERPFSKGHGISGHCDCWCGEVKE
jgi:hypothetical protein